MVTPSKSKRVTTSSQSQSQQSTHSSMSSSSGQATATAARDPNVTTTIYERHETETRERRTHTPRPTSPEISSASATHINSPLTRSQEKEELQYLNSRLASYIDRIRSQEDEIGTLRRRIETIETSETSETRKVKDAYDRELANLRAAVDEFSREKAALTIERDSLKSKNQELGAKITSLENEKGNLQRKLRDAELLLEDLKNKMARAKDQLRALEQDAENLRRENDDMSRQLETLRQEVANETLKRVDLENRLLTAQEDLSFKAALHDQEIRNLRVGRTTAITETESRVRGEYDSRINEHLAELRREFEEMAQTTREELETNYLARIADMQTLADRHKDAARDVYNELQKYQQRVNESQQKIDRLSAENRSLQSRLDDAMRNKDDEIQKLQHLLAERQDELQRVYRELSEHIQQYEALMDEKIQLDAELATYHRLLISEEERLHMPTSPFPSKEGTATSGRGVKRRAGQTTETRIQQTASSKGPIQISEIDPDGQFVRLDNKSNQDFHIGGWSLRMVSDADEDGTYYKFHLQLSIKANATMTVWSGNTNVTHEPPADLVMEGRWLVGDNTKVTLMDAEGTEMAKRELFQTTSRMGSERLGGMSGSPIPKRHRVLAGRDGSDGTDRHHRQDNCQIM